MIKKLKKIEDSKLLLNENIEIFRCPVCKKSIESIKMNSIVCKSNHCFDISKKGYVNLLKNSATTIYDKGLFESRSKIYNEKNYDNLYKEIINIVDQYTINKEKNCSCNKI